MAGAATALRADVWQTADSLRLPGIERGSETAVQRWTRVQQCAYWGLRGVGRSSRPSIPIATNAVFNCRSQELPASHSFHRRSGLEDVPHRDHVKKAGAGARETAKTVLAGSEEASVWRRRVSVGGSGGHQGNAESRFSFGGKTKCSLRAGSPWLMAAETERRGSVLRATRTPTPNVRDDEEEEEKEPFVRPKLPGDEPDFWEGEQWDWLGFILQYLWAVGIVVALIGGLVAVRTYNSGAVDYKDTIEYQSAMEIVESTKEGAGESQSPPVPSEATSVSSPAPSE